MLHGIFGSMAHFNQIPEVCLIKSIDLYIFKLFPEASEKYRKAEDPQIIALQLAFTKQRFVNVLKAWHQSMGINAIPAFRKSVKQLYFLFPIAYSIFFASAFVTIGNIQEQNLNPLVHYLLLVPIFAGLAKKLAFHKAMLGPMTCSTKSKISGCRATFRNHGS